MLPPETTSMQALHDGVVDALRDHFGNRIRQYGAYEPWDDVADQPEDDIKTPALLFAVDGISPDDDGIFSPGRVGIRCELTVHAVLSIQTENLQAKLPELAAAVIALVRRTESAPGVPPLNGNRWGLGEAADTPESVSARPDEFRPGLNGRDSWVVTWEQVIYLPESLPE